MIAAMVDEHTSGRDEARRALAESRASSRQADKLIERSAIVTALIEAHNAPDHFVDRLRETIRGTS